MNFLATLSHELRTPLNAVLGWTNILQRGNIQREELKQGLETIERNARIQAQIIEDLLDMSRIISGKVRLEAPADRSFPSSERVPRDISRGGGGKKRSSAGRDGSLCRIDFRRSQSLATGLLEHSSQRY